jgi:hypothetical protein
MPPFPLLQRPPDPQRARLEFDIVPLQAQHLTLAQSQREGDLPPDGVSSVGRCSHDRPGLTDRKRFDLALLRPSRASSEDRIAVHLSPPDGLTET